MRKSIGLLFLLVAALTIATQPEVVLADPGVAPAPAPAVVIQGEFCFFSDAGQSTDVLTASSNGNRNFSCTGSTSNPPAATIQFKAICSAGGRLTHNAHVTITKSGRVSVQCHFNG